MSCKLQLLVYIIFIWSCVWSLIKVPVINRNASTDNRSVSWGMDGCYFRVYYIGVWTQEGTRLTLEFSLELRCWPLRKLFFKFLKKFLTKKICGPSHFPYVHLKAVSPLPNSYLYCIDNWGGLPSEIALQRGNLDPNIVYRGWAWGLRNWNRIRKRENLNKFSWNSKFFNFSMA